MRSRQDLSIVQAVHRKLTLYLLSLLPTAALIAYSALSGIAQILVPFVGTYGLISYYLLEFLKNTIDKATEKIQVPTVTVLSSVAPGPESANSFAASEISKSGP